MENSTLDNIEALRLAALRASRLAQDALADVRNRHNAAEDRFTVLFNRAHIEDVPGLRAAEHEAEVLYDIRKDAERAVRASDEVYNFVLALSE